MNSSLAQAIRPGDVIAGKYRVERVLGSGGMGTVVAAMHMDLDEIRAIKLMHPNQLDNAQAVERFLREARATRRLKSEHVPMLYDVGRLESGAPYMVMEALEGQDLRTMLKARGQLPIEEAVLYILQACEAIAEAHAIGIIHRDLKPANLFLTRRDDGSPSVKVLDFGISKLLFDPSGGADMTKTLDVLGSVHYMAPEQLRSSRDVDARADVWSLGVILYRLLTGRLPFPGDTPVAYIMALRDALHSPSAFRSDLPPELGAVIMKSLEKDPEKRTRSVAELMIGLIPFGAGGNAQRAAPVDRASDSGNMREAAKVAAARPPPPLPTPLPNSMPMQGAPSPMPRPAPVPIPLPLPDNYDDVDSLDLGQETKPMPSRMVAEAMAARAPLTETQPFELVPLISPTSGLYAEDLAGDDGEGSAGEGPSGQGPISEEAIDASGYLEPSDPQPAASNAASQSGTDTGADTDADTGADAGTDTDAPTTHAAVSTTDSAVSTLSAVEAPAPTIPERPSRAAPRRAPSRPNTLSLFILLGCLMGALAGIIIAVVIVMVKREPEPNEVASGAATASPQAPTTSAAAAPEKAPEPLAATAPTAPSVSPVAATSQSAAPADTAPPAESAAPTDTAAGTPTSTPTSTAAITTTAPPLVGRLPTKKPPPTSTLTSAPAKPPAPEPTRSGPIFE